MPKLITHEFAISARIGIENDCVSSGRTAVKAAIVVQRFGSHFRSFLAVLMICSLAVAGWQWHSNRDLDVVSADSATPAIAKPEEVSSETSNESIQPVAYQEPSKALLLGVPTGVQLRFVEFLDQPMVDAALSQIWDQSPDSTAVRPPGPTQARTRVMSAEELATILNPLTSSGLAAVRDSAIQMPQDLVRSLSIESQTKNDVISITLSANCKNWQSAVNTEFRRGETLVVEGPAAQAMFVEVSRIPYLGDLPMLGPSLFSSKKVCTVTQRSVLLITADDEARQ